MATNSFLKYSGEIVSPLTFYQLFDVSITNSQLLNERNQLLAEEVETTRQQSSVSSLDYEHSFEVSGSGSKIEIIQCSTLGVSLLKTIFEVKNSVNYWLRTSLGQ